MEYIHQDEKLLEINKIKNIKAISLTSLMMTKDTNVGVPTIVCVYDDGVKTLCYSGIDKEFLHFYEIVRRVYETESKTRDILIDNETLSFLTTKVEDLKLDELKKEIGSISTKNRKINYKIKENEMYFKMLKYVLEDILKFINRNVELKTLKGINKTFALIGTEDGLSKNFPFEYSYDEDFNKRIFIFPGIFNQFHELVINIIEDNPLKIEFSSPQEKLVGDIEYIVNGNKGFSSTTLYVDGECIYKKQKDLKILENNPYEEIFKLMGINGKCVVLPWGDARVVTNTLTTNEIEQSVTKITDFKINTSGTHISITETMVETLSKDNYRGIKGKLNITSLEEKKITNLYLVRCEEENYIIRETSFIPSLLGRGLYKSELAGNHFYKIYKVNANTLENLEPNSIQEVLNEVEENDKGYQLLNEFELKLLLRRTK